MDLPPLMSYPSFHSSMKWELFHQAQLHKDFIIVLYWWCAHNRSWHGSAARDLMLRVWRWHHIVRDEEQTISSWSSVIIQEGMKLSTSLVEGGKKRRGTGRRKKRKNQHGIKDLQDHPIDLPDWQKKTLLLSEGLSSLNRRTRSQESLLGVFIASVAWLLAYSLPLESKLRDQSKFPLWASCVTTGGDANDGGGKEAWYR